MKTIFVKKKLKKETAVNRFENKKHVCQGSVQGVGEYLSKTRIFSIENMNFAVA